ncbi:MAG: G5 domain-containing protein [Firmicutes bacterium]|nr:G5 domain-containing protein [Bacillota bacterium]
MLQYTDSIRRRTGILYRILLLTIPALLLVTVLSQAVLARNTYLINDDGRILLHYTYATDPEDVLSEIGVTVGEDDLITTQPRNGISEITVQRLQTITVVYNGQTLTLTSYGGTVEELLESAGITLGEWDEISVDLEEPTADGMEFTVSTAYVVTESSYSAIPYSTLYCEDTGLADGEQEILSAGKDGVLYTIADIYYVNGQEVSRTVLSETVISQSVEEIVAVGSYVEVADPVPMTSSNAVSIVMNTQPFESESGSADEEETPTNSENTFVTADGEVVTYSKVITCVATAYSCNGQIGYTYTGTIARVGEIAADPSVIPPGTRMYIYTNDGEYVYGYAVAEDTGGAIKGNIVDLYFNSDAECYAFGRRTCTIYILD